MYFGRRSYLGWLKIQTKEQCMCWTGDHYRQASCSEKPDHADVSGMDTLKMRYFRRITQPDTITRLALGHVWYSKIDGDIEFYTAGGVHPVHRERRLKPLTMYVLTKYLLTIPSTGIVSNLIPDCKVQQVGDIAGQVWSRKNGSDLFPDHNTC